MAEINLIALLLTCGTVLFIDILLIIDSHSVFINSLSTIKKLKHIIYASTVQVIVYLLEYVFCQYKFFGIRTLGMFMESAIYICNLIYISTYAKFIYARYVKERQIFKIKKIFFLLPIYILIPFVIINIFVPIFFNLVPGTLEYVETPWVLIINILPVLYLTYAGIYDIKDLKKNTCYNYLPISLYFLPSLIGVALEMFCPDLPIVPMFCLLSISIMYIRVLKQTSYLDSLSGIYTKSQLSIYIKSSLNKLASDEKLAGIMLDLNDFKAINDNYGHVTGDKAIQTIGNILKEATKKIGLCFRYDGDEFIIILKVRDLNQINQLIEKINQLTEEFNEKKTEKFSLSFSQGFALYDTVNDTPLTFVEKIDQEMYVNKRASK